MDQNKIGIFISKIRKNKKLTQKELAERLHISEKTISKWECGKGLPEVSLMKPLCKELDITVTELLNGEKESTEEGVINFIDYTKRKSKHKIIFLSIIFILLITFILSTVVYFFNTYNKIAVYRLYGESEHFYIKDLYVTKSNIYNMIAAPQVESKSTDIKSEDIKSLILKYGDKTIIGGLPMQNVTEKNGYNEIFSEEKLNNIDKWYIEIQYDDNDKLTTEIIELKNEVLMRNNEFISKKINSIGYEQTEDAETYEEREIKKSQEIKRIGNILVENGYQKSFEDELGDFVSYAKDINKFESVEILLTFKSPEIFLYFNNNIKIELRKELHQTTNINEDIIETIYINDKIYKIKYDESSDKYEIPDYQEDQTKVIEILQEYIKLRKELYKLIYE